MKKELLIAFFFALLVTAFTPITAADGLPLTLRRYEVSCDEDSFAYLLRYFWRKESIKCEVVIDGCRLPNATLRLRGETSRTYPKKSFKINLDRDYRFEGRDKLNLISEWTDATFAREFLAYDLYHRLGLLASRAWFAQLYLNGRYAGLYLDVENVDQHFLKLAGLDEDGALYKADENGTLLKPGEIEAGLWDRKTEPEDDFAPLQTLVDWLDRVSDADFLEGLQRWFNLRDLCCAIAVNSLIGNSSTYYHNYYLLRTTGAEGRWRYLPWDMDATFKYALSYSEPPYALCGQHLAGTNKLVRRCWLNPAMRDVIISNINYIADNYFQSAYYRPRCDSLRELLHDAVAADIAKQFTLDDFEIMLDNLPSEIDRRRARIQSDIRLPPYPFDVISAEPAAGAVKFNWTSASADSTIIYSIYIDHTTLFNKDLQIIPCGKDTSLTINLAGPDTLFWRVSARIPGSRWCNSLTIASKLIVPAYVPPVDTLPERIDGQLTLTAEGGPYFIPQDFVIERGAELRIRPGAVVSVADSCWVLVDGSLIIEGAPEDTFSFLPASPGNTWEGIHLGIGGEGAFLSASWTRFNHLQNNSFPVYAYIGTVKLDYCEIIANGVKGLNLFRTDSEIKDSRFFADKGCALESDYTDRLVLTDCEFIGSHQDSEKPLVLLSNHTGSASISGCRFAGGFAGIILTGANGVKIDGCWFEDLSTGISAYRSPSVWLTNSIFTNCGVGFEGGGSSISNNDFALCSVGVSAYRGDLAINNSVLWRCSQPFNSSASGEYSFRYCIVDPGESPPGEGNDSSGPRFVDPWNGDFTPQDDSPLLDAGDGDIAPRFDYCGAPRVDIIEIANRGRGRASWTDIGAIERQEGGIPRHINLALSTLESYPNPTNERATVVFLIEADGPVVLSISDMNGRLIYQRSYRNLPAGEYRQEWRAAEHTPNGIYFCRLEQAAGTSVWKLAVVR